MLKFNLLTEKSHKNLISTTLAPDSHPGPRKLLIESVTALGLKMSHIVGKVSNILPSPTHPTYDIYKGSTKKMTRKTTGQSSAYSS